MTIQSRENIDDFELENDLHDEFEELPEIDDLQKLLVDLGGDSDAEGRIFRQPGDGRTKMQYIFTFTPGDYTYGQLLEKIKSEYGGGDYRVHIRSGGKLVANRPFSIAAPQKKEGPDLESIFERKSMEQTLMHFMERQAEQQNALLERIAGMGNNQPQVSPLDMMASVVGMMVQLKELNGDSKKETDPVAEMLRLEKLRKMLTSDGVSDRAPETSDLLAKAIDQFGPMFNKVLAGGARPKQPAQIPHHQKAPPVAVAEPQLKAQSGDTDPRMAALQHLMGHAQVLIAAAARNANPETYADVVLDFTDDDALPALYEMIAAEDSIEMLAAFAPPVQQFRPWFEQLRLAIMAALELPPEPDSGITGESGSGMANDNDDSAINGHTAGGSGHESHVADNALSGTPSQNPIAD